MPCIIILVAGRDKTQTPGAEIQNEKETHMRQYFMKKVFRIMMVTFALLISLLPASAAADCASEQNSAKNAYVTNVTTEKAAEAETNNTTAGTADGNKIIVKVETRGGAADNTAAASKAADTTAAEKANNAAANTTAATTKPAETKPETTKPETTKPAETTKAPVANNSSVQDIERQVVVLVNQARKERGLGELKLNEELSNVARVKANDMAKNHYFDHNSPTYGSPFDMMKQFGISYRTAGENIAMGQTTAQQVFDGWMNSEGHRANILNPNFKEIGMGYTSNGNYWSQMFIG